MDEPLINQIPPRQTGREGVSSAERRAAQKAIELKALEDAVTERKAEIESAHKTLAREKRQRHGEHPVEARPDGTVRLDQRKSTFTDFEVTICRNGEPHVAIIPFTSAPTPIE